VAGPLSPLNPGVRFLYLRDEISRGIVNSRRLKRGRGQRQYETNAEAYDLYLRARALAARRFPGDSDVIDSFEKAIAKDPSLPQPMRVSPRVRVSVMWSGTRSRGQHIENGAAAEKAIHLDPLLAEARSALGQHMHVRDSGTRRS
jgi:hypothetical protein